MFLSDNLHTLSVVFEDGFNDHGTNYNSPRTKTVYSVDSYDIVTAALCLTSDSPVIKSDGSIVEVGDLSEGDVLKDMVDSLDEHSDATFLNWYTSSLVETPKDVTVKNITFSFSNKIYNINNGEIKGTSEHPMLISKQVLLLIIDLEN